MANYPPTFYQQPMGWQQPMYQQAPQQDQLFCRMVGSRDEVNAFPVEYSGRPMTFLGPGLQTMWVKTFNPATGGSDVAEYHKAQPAQAEQPKYATMADLEQVLQVLQKQSEDIALLKGQRRRAMKEDESNE